MQQCSAARVDVVDDDDDADDNAFGSIRLSAASALVIPNIIGMIGDASLCLRVCAHRVDEGWGEY